MLGMLLKRAACTEMASWLSQVVDLDALRELAWSGVPSDLRPTCWQLLLGYLPPNRERR